MENQMEKFVFTNTKLEFRKKKDGELYINNLLVVARPGTQKLRTFYIPNILNEKEDNLIIKDENGYLLETCGHALEEAGYTVRCLDLYHPSRSNTYNPFQNLLYSNTQTKERKYNVSKEELNSGSWIVEEYTTYEMIHILLSQFDESKKIMQDDPAYWVSAEEKCLKAAVVYMIHNYPKEDYSFVTLSHLVEKMLESNEKGDQSQFDQMIHDWKECPYSNINSYWGTLPKTTMNSIATCLQTCLKKIVDNTEVVPCLCNEDTMNISACGEANKKIAWFIGTKPDSKQYNVINVLFCVQLLQCFKFYCREFYCNEKENPSNMKFYLLDSNDLDDFFPLYIVYMNILRKHLCTVFDVSKFENLSENKDSRHLIGDMIGGIFFIDQTNKTIQDTLKMITGKIIENIETEYQYGLVVMMESLAGVVDYKYNPLYKLEEHPKYHSLYFPWDESEENQKKKYSCGDKNK